jgi:hypothetical protein
MAAFVLGRLPGPKQRSRRPEPAPTAAEIAEMIGRSFLTVQEAKRIAFLALCRPLEWQGPSDPTNPKLRRDAPEDEDDVPEDENPDGETAGA